MTVVEFSAGPNGQVFVEVPSGDGDTDTGLVRAGAGDRVVRAATQSWHSALSGIRQAAEGALAQLRSVDPPPDEVEVTFGVAVDGKLGATLVSAGTNAHLNVKVVWRNPPGASGPEGP